LDFELGAFFFEFLVKRVVLDSQIQPLLDSKFKAQSSKHKVPSTKFKVQSSKSKVQSETTDQ